MSQYETFTKKVKVFYFKINDLDFKIHKILLALPFLFLGIFSGYGQITYYSRNDAVNLPRQWDDGDSWTLSSDGSGLAAAIPQQIDHVVILTGHTIEIDDTADNGGPATSAADLGFGPFASSTINNFYHLGNITIEISATLTSSARVMLGGVTFIAGDMSMGGDIINMGDMFFTSSSTFDSQDDLIISGSSNTRIDITDVANSFSNDDLYIDNTIAFLCGLGVLEIGVNPNTAEIQLLNGATMAQVCTVFVITGCDPVGTCPSGTTVYSPTAPVLTGTGTTLMYTENDVVAVDPGIVLTYGEPFLTTATISVTNNYVDGEDVMELPESAGINSSFVSATGVLTLTGYGSISEWESVLQSVTYENLSDNPTVSIREISFSITDGFATSNTISRNIEIEAVNDPPDVSTISGSPTPLEYTENDVAVSVDPQIEVADPDDINLEGATVTISANYVEGEDILDFTNTADITGLWVPADGKMELSGTATILDYQQALRDVTYFNSSDNPSVSNRTVGFVVDDGDAITNPPFTRDIEITAVNDAPDITSTADPNATEDILYTYTATVTDPDDPNNGTALTWSLTNAPAGMVVSLTGEVTWTPVEGVLTSGTVTLTVQDDGEDGALPDTENFTITVTPVNDPPVINSMAGTVATEEMLYTYTASVMDPDDANNGVELMWSLSNAPGDMVVSATGEVTWTPAEGVLTSGIVTLTVQDDGEDGAAPDTEDFTIAVTPINDPPIITSTADPNATEDILYTYTATVSDPDDANNGSELTWALTNAPAGMIISLTGEVTWTPTEGILTSGTVTLTVEDDGEDGALPDTEDFIIAVTPVNDPPVINSTAGTAATEEMLYTYTASVTDPDDANNGTELTWSLANAPVGMIVSLTGEVTWTPSEGVLTSGTVTLTVQDDGEDGAAPDTEDFTIAVTPINDPPMITTTAGLTATEDILYTYAATVSDPDDANDGLELTWSLTNAPFGMAVSITGEVTWTPTEGVLTSSTVTLSVADGGENAVLPSTEDFIISVIPVNDPPVITSVAGTSGTEELLYSYTATVSDPDDLNDGVGGLTWTLVNEPSGMVVSSTGLVTWTPAIGVTTSGLVTLTVQDGGEDGALAAAENFTIAVTEFNDPPEITSTAPTMATEDILYTYSAIVSDPDDLNDGIELTWTLSGEPAGMTVSTTGGIQWTPGEGILTSGTITLSVQDGMENGANAAEEIFTIMVTPVNDSPEISGTSSDLDYNEGSGPQIIDDLITITDVDDNDLELATVSLGASFIPGEDFLSFTDQNGISGSFDTGTGILTLSGTSSLSNYMSALVSISYENTSVDPDLSVRSISFIINDGQDDSESFTRNIVIIGANDPPDFVDGSGFAIDTVRFEIMEDEVGTFCVLTLDPDLNTVHLEAISTGTADGIFDNGDTSDLCFSFTPSQDFYGLVYGALTICDDGSPVSCNNAVVEITVIPVNDPPVAIDDAYNAIEDQEIIGNVMDNDFDPESDALSVDTTPILSPLNGVLLLNSDGTFSYIPNKDFFGQDLFTYRICDNGIPSACAEADVLITIQDEVDAVVVYQVLTPNEDNFNDTWVIEGIGQYPTNNVRLFDRWSNLVYQIDGYNNMDKIWIGDSNKGISKGDLPNGTYYYVINLGDGSDILEGFVELKRQ